MLEIYYHPEICKKAKAKTEETSIFGYTSNYIKKPHLTYCGYTNSEGNVLLVGCKNSNGFSSYGASFSRDMYSEKAIRKYYSPNPNFVSPIERLGEFYYYNAKLTYPGLLWLVEAARLAFPMPKYTDHVHSSISEIKGFL